MPGFAGSALPWFPVTVPGAAEADEDCPHLACLSLAPRGNPGTRHGGWLTACYRLTPDVERIAPHCALLDLGRGSAPDAQAAVQGLRRHLEQRGFQARVGIAPSLILAQLAAFMALADQPLLLVTPATTQLFLRRVPVAVLLQLHPQGRVPPEIVERLQQYGLHTLGHLARLEERALCRQFGSVGTFLARVAAGQDTQSLHPTPRPAHYSVGLRFGSAAPPEQVLTALDRLSERVATRLQQQGRQARQLGVRVRWETGGVERTRLSLRRHTNDPAVIAQELRRLLLPLVGAPALPAADEANDAGRRPWAPGDAGEHGENKEYEGVHSRSVEELRIILGDFLPGCAQQAAFWRADEQRWTTLQVVAESLARRHARPLLLRGEAVRPSAIFSEECHRLTAIGAPGPARRVWHMPTPQHGEAPPSPWQVVPQRLHWW